MTWNQPRCRCEVTATGVVFPIAKRLVKTDPETGLSELRMRMSLHPYYLMNRQKAGRKNHFKPEKARLLDTTWPVLISFCDKGKPSIGMCTSRLAHEVSPKDEQGEVIPETAVTVSRMSRLISEQVRHGVLAVSEEKCWTASQASGCRSTSGSPMPVSGYWART